MAQQINETVDQYYGVHLWLQGLAYTPDGTELYVADGPLVTRYSVPDTVRGPSLFASRWYNDPLKSIALSPDGAYLAVATSATTLLYETQTQRRVAAISVGGGRVVFSPDGTRLLIDGSDGGVDRASVRSVPSLDEVFSLGISSILTSAAFSADGNLIATGASNSNVALFNGQTGAFIKATSHSGVVNAIRFSADATKLLVAYSSNVVRLWDIDTSAVDKALPHTGPVIDAHFFASEAQALTTGQNGTVQLWDLDTETQLYTAELPGQNTAPRIAFSPTANEIAVGGMGHIITFLNPATGAELRRIEGQTGQLLAVAVSSDETRLLTGSNDDTAALWDTETAERLQVFAGHTGDVTGVAFVPEEPGQIITSSRDSTAKLWDADSGLVQRTFAGHTAAIRDIDVSPDGRLLATASEDGTARLWNIATGQQTALLDEHTETVTRVVFSPSGAFVVTASNDDTVKVWSTTAKASVRTFTDHQASVRALAVHPNGMQVLSADENGAIILWDSETGVVDYTIDRQFFPEWVHFSPSGEQFLAQSSPNILSGGPSASATLWDTETGSALLEFRLQDNSFSVYYPAAAFSPGGSRIYFTEGSNAVVHRRRINPQLKARTWQAHDPGAGAASYADIDFSPTGLQVLTTFQSPSEASLWDTNTGDFLWGFDVPSGALSGDYALDGRYVAAASQPAGLVVDTATTELVANVANVNGGIAFSPDGTRLVTGNTFGGAQLVALPDGDVTTTDSVLSSTRAVDFAWSGDRAAVSSASNSLVSVINTSTGSEVAAYEGHDGVIRAVTYAPNGRFVASSQSGGIGTSLHVWDPQTGSLLWRDIHGRHGGTVNDIDVDGIGGLIATGSEDGTAIVWDAASGVPLARFLGPGTTSTNRAVKGVALSADGTLLALINAKGVVCIYRTGLGLSERARIVPIGLNEPLKETVPGLRATYFRLDLDPGAADNLVVEVIPTDAPENWTVLGRLGSLPTFTTARWRGRGPNAAGAFELLVPGAPPGTYYFAVIHSAATPDPEEFCIEIREAERYVSGLSSGFGGNGGEVFVDAFGLGFVPGMQVQLRDTTGAVLGTFTPTLIESGQMTIPLDLSGLDPQDADIAFLWPDSEEQVLRDSFEIRSGTGPRLEVRCVTPPATRVGRTYVMSLVYENAGDANMAAPLVSVTGQPGLLVSQTREGPFTEGPVQILATSSREPHTVLRPGDGGRKPLFFMPTQGDVTLHFDTAVAAPDGTAINWAALESQIRPEGLSDPEWDAVFARLQQELGPTYIDYYNGLVAYADLLQARRLDACDVAVILRAIAEEALGLPTAAITGIVCQSDTLEPVPFHLVRVFDDSGLVYRQTETDSQGLFAIHNLPDGVYRVVVEDWLVESPPDITIAGQVDAFDVQVKVIELPRDDAGNELPLSQHHYPALATTAEGDVIMVWENGPEVWYARWSHADGAWVVARQLADAVGGRPDVAYSASVADLGGEPGLMAAWESRDTETGVSRIQSSLGQRVEGAWQWTEVATETADANSDLQPLLGFLPSGDVLLIFLQRASPADDTDVYSGLIEPSAAGPVFTGKAAVWTTPFHLKQDSCIDLNLAKGTRLPRWVPYLGGRYAFEITGQLCGPNTCEGATRSGSLTMSLDLSDNVTGTGNITGSAMWNIDKDVCEYVFNLAQLDVSVGAEGTFPSPSVPLVVAGVPIGTASGSVTVGGTYTGTIQWHGNFPGFPDAGFVTLALTGSVTGEASLFRGGLTGSLTGTLSGSARYTPPADFSFLGYCVKLEATGSALWGAVEEDWSKSWGSLCDDKAFRTLLAKGGYAYTAGHDYVWIQEASLAKQGNEVIPIVSQVLYDISEFTGTGGVYEGTAVQADVATDVYNDHGHALAQFDTESLLLWVNDTGDYANALGGTVVAASYSGGAWGAVEAVDSTVNFNKDVAVAFAGSANAMALWSQASSAGLNSSSLLQDLFDAADAADIVFARRVSGVWEAAAPLAVMAGRDEYPALASRQAGQYMAVWWNVGGDGVHTLYASLWNGTTWSTPEAIATAMAADPPAISATGNGYLVTWAQDIDGVIEVSDDWGIRYAVYASGEWSSPATLPNGAFDTAEAKQLDDYNEFLDRIGSTTRRRFPAPPECCDDDPTNDPTPGLVPFDGQQNSVGLTPVTVVRSNDPNEKVGTAGLGPQRFVEAGTTLSYIVYFENVATASAPAQEVFVVDALDGNLDWTTFRVTEFAWGDQVVPVTAPAAEYVNRVTVPDHRAEVNRLWWVDILVEPDLATGRVQWTFRTLDPETGDLPIDALAGFLPPNDGTGIGEGHVVFEVDIKAGLPDGTVIRNAADIIFDQNEVIRTNEVFNTIGRPSGIGADIDNNGVVNAVDIQLVINATLGVPIDPGFNADVNNDGEINALDIQTVINTALGVNE